MEAVASSTLNPKLDYPVKEREESQREHFVPNVSEDLVATECPGWRALRRRRLTRSVTHQERTRKSPSEKTLCQTCQKT